MLKSNEMGPENEVLTPNEVAIIMLSTVRLVDTKPDTKTNDCIIFGQSLSLSLERAGHTPNFRLPKIRSRAMDAL